MFRTTSLVVLLIATSVVGNAQSSRHKPVSPNDAIRKADQHWLRVFAAKDLTKSVDFVIAGGSVLAPNAPIATGHDAISKSFAGFFALPDLKIEWRPNKVELARSGEMGYSTGAYHMTFKDPSGKTI
ncbi:MAG TPA: hypothetical protein VK557_08380 [Pyrinomonadaceae bacterium]|nr:hypothetical protein [Pyrinomonadaceae bacterium]